MGVFRRVQRGKVAATYSIRFTAANGIRKTLVTSATTEEEALKLLHEMEEEVRKARVAKVREKAAKTADSMMLSAASARTYAEQWAPNKDGERPSQQIEKIISLMGDVKLSRIDGTWLGDLKVKMLEQKYSPASINRYFAALKTILRLAHYDWGVLPALPRFRMFSEKAFQRDYTFSEEQLQSVCQYFADKGMSDMGDLVLVLSQTGMRLSECLTMTYGTNINLSECVITLTNRMTKASSTRSVPMSAEVQEILERRQTVGLKPFPYNIYTIEWRWKRMQRALNLPDGVIHCLRHTFATRLTANGVDLSTVQTLLGHSTPTMTTRYSHMKLGTLRVAIGTLANSD